MRHTLNHHQIFPANLGLDNEKKSATFTIFKVYTQSDFLASHMLQLSFHLPSLFEGNIEDRNSIITHLVPFSISLLEGYVQPGCIFTDLEAITAGYV